MINTPDNTASNFPCLSSLFLTIFPGFSGSTFHTWTRAEDFNTAALTEVMVSRLQVKYRNHAERTILLLVPGQQEELPFNRSKMTYGTQDRLTQCGLPTVECSFTILGIKNFSTLSEKIRQTHLVISGAFRNSPFHLLFSYLFLAEILKAAGHSSATEVLQPQRFRTEWTATLSRLERSILFSRCQLFLPPTAVFELMPPKDAAFLLNQLLRDDALTHDHLASLETFYPRMASFTFYLSKKNKAAIGERRRIQANWLAVQSQAQRWKLQLTWYLQRCLSRHIFEDGGTVHTPGIDLRDWHGLVPVITEVRLRWREREAPFPTLIDRIVRERTATAIISTEAKNLLAILAAQKEDINLDGFCRLFSQNFRLDIEERAQRAAMDLSHRDRENRHRHLVETKYHLYRIVESDLTLAASRHGEEGGEATPADLQEKLSTLSEDRFHLLFEVLGHVRFAEMFDILRYLPDSPLCGEPCDAFQESCIAALPQTERSLIEDICAEHINQDRIINETILRRRLNVLMTRLKALTLAGYLPDTEP